MGNLNLSQINSLPDVLKDSKWYVRFAKMPAVSGITASEIDLRAVTMDVPKATTGVIEVTIRENTIRVPGRKSYSQSLTLNMIETVDMKTMQFLKDWRELCSEYNTNRVATKADREATILLYHCNDRWDEAWSYKIYRCWLSDFTPPQLTDGSSPSAYKVPLVLTYTHFTDNVMNTEV